MVLTIRKPTKYALPIEYPRPLTMAGEYLTKKKYASLIRK